MTESSESPDATNGRQSHGHLLRVLGVGFGLAVTIGGTIGMGILRTPGEIAKELPTPTLFIGIWIVGGLYALLGDRKSTRLNSSHRCISYAVFCLKKKKK